MEFQEITQYPAAWERTQTRISVSPSPETEFNQFHKSLSRHHDPIRDTPIPSRIKPPYVRATERDYEIMREIRKERDRGNKEKVKRGEWECFNRYGTNDWAEIAEMYDSVPNPGVPLGDMEPSSDAFWRDLHYNRPQSRRVLRGGPRIAPKSDTESEEEKAAPSKDIKVDCAGLSANQLSTEEPSNLRDANSAGLQVDCDGSFADKLSPEKPSGKSPRIPSPKMSRSESETRSEIQDFRAGGIRRGDRDGDTDSHDAGSLSESDLFPGPCGSTFLLLLPMFRPSIQCLARPVGTRLWNSHNEKSCLVVYQRLPAHVKLQEHRTARK